MLVLSRSVNQSILIGDNIEIKIVAIKGSGDGATVRIGIEAPREVRVLRAEVPSEVAEANRTAQAPEATAGLEALLQQLQLPKDK